MIRKAVIVVLTLTSVILIGVWALTAYRMTFVRLGYPEFVTDAKARWFDTATGQHYKKNPDRWYVYSGHLAYRWSVLVPKSSAAKPQRLEFGRSYFHRNRYSRNVIRVRRLGPHKWTIGRHPMTRDEADEYTRKMAAYDVTDLVVTDIRLPFWPLAIPLSIYPTIAFIRGPLRRWRRKRRGLCLACGYDLKGNVTGVCSECGTRIESS